MAEEVKFENLKIEWPTKTDDDGTVLREGTIDGNYAVISINRPDKLNSLTDQVLAEISQALRMMEVDGSVRAVVIRGVKEFTKKPAFSAGADLSTAFNMNLKMNIPWHMAQAMRIKHREYAEFEQFNKPLIAAVDGFALGGGFEIVLCCDIVIASDRSLFGLPEINRGIFPANGGVTRLAARVGLNRAMRVAMFGEHHDAKTMEDWGLVSWTAPAGDEFEKLVHEKAKWMGDAPTTALFVIKKCVKFGTRYEEIGVIMEQMGFGINQVSFDAKEGIMAFNRKIKCPVCGGKGKFEDGTKCDNCKGRRKIKDTPHFKGY
jgi:enoyl-CoA hydratase/3-hydroxyacyl-CoA dehydrogenase